MKVLSLAFFIFFSVTGKAQDSTITLSQFEKFVGRPTALTKTISFVVGEFGGYQVSKLIATEVATGNRSTAFKLEGNNGKLSSSLIHATHVYIDSAEVESVTNTVEVFLKLAEQENLTIDQVFKYTTANDIQFTCYYDRLYNRWTFYVEKVYQTLRTHVPGTYASFNKKRMKEFLALLQTAKNGLQTL